MFEKKITLDTAIGAACAIGIVISLYLDRNEYMAFGKAAIVLSLTFLAFGLNRFFLLYGYIKSGLKDKPHRFWPIVALKFIQAAFFLFLSIKIVVG